MTVPERQSKPAPRPEVLKIELFLAGPEDTLDLGRRLGRLAGPGLVIALSGPLGAGKTCLTQGLASGLGLADDQPVTSPSFVLVNEYDLQPPLYHLDLYRLDQDGFLDAGLDEYLTRPGVIVLEWADRISGLLPEPRLEIELTPTPAGGRRAVLRAFGSRPADILKKLG
ncbi:MAG: tRNA (adenosine(37)-N6)-threonylcarbamoyltransferase complex ATPase subunit type 1 TsaE [Thermodesulfobacteriota bacterium]